MIELIKGYLPAILDNIPLFPPQASTVAAEVDALFFVWTLVSVVSSAIILAAMAYFLVRYRRRSFKELGGGETHAPMVELVSMAIPFIVCMIMFVWGTKVFIQIQRTPETAVEYLAFGKQWMWKFQHPNGLREINNLTIPVNTPIQLTMTSEDVVHSFWVPEFRVKQDVFPGSYSSLWFEATQTGTFRVFCAEYCGTDHAVMSGRVHVLEQDEYDAWLREEEPERADPVSSGEQLFTSLSCDTCHTGDSPRGPALTNLFGSRVQLASGESVTADETYLRTAITDPRSQVRAGYAALMPTFQGQVTEVEIRDLISYIKTLDQASQPDSARAEPELTQLRAQPLSSARPSLTPEHPVPTDEPAPSAGATLAGGN